MGKLLFPQRETHPKTIGAIKREGEGLAAKILLLR
jgi:hypothetical protein